MLQIPRFLPFFAFLPIFTCTKALYVRHTYLIGIYCLVFVYRTQPNTYPRPNRMKPGALRPYSCCKYPHYLPFFAFSPIFTGTKALYVRHTYLIGIYCFVFVQRTQPNTYPRSNRMKPGALRPYSCCKSPFFLPFFARFFAIFTFLTFLDPLYAMHSYLMVLYSVESNYKVEKIKYYFLIEFTFNIGFHI